MKQTCVIVILAFYPIPTKIAPKAPLKYPFSYARFLYKNGIGLQIFEHVIAAHKALPEQKLLECFAI